MATAEVIKTYTVTEEIEIPDGMTDEQKKEWAENNSCALANGVSSEDLTKTFVSITEYGSDSFEWEE